VDNGVDHRRTTDRSSSATQSSYTVNNSSCQTRHHLADVHLLSSRRVSSVDGRLGTVRRPADVYHIETDVLHIVADCSCSSYDASPAVLDTRRVYGHHRILSFKISALQDPRKSTP